MTNLTLHVEFIYREEELSTGIHSRSIPVVRFIYFERDESTGAAYVSNIVEADLIDENQRSRAAYIALHVVDWYEEFDNIQCHAEAVAKFMEISRMDLTDNFTACRMLSYALHMMVADYYGYVDNEGDLTNTGEGENIFAAYKAKPDCDLGAYVRAAS